jgi:NAD(P)-dependent dehydrogenase (short-subunit alcohol dehydrogenase family)
MSQSLAKLNGKVCVVTGATSGIGLETARALARLGADIVLACRDTARGEQARRKIARNDAGAVSVMPLDLASQKSTRAFADAFRSRHRRLDILVNNAAIVPARRETTEDGIEKQFGVNHLGPFLLTMSLLDVIRASAPSRIINVSSTVHHGATIAFDDLQSTRNYGAMKAYGQSKLANVMFTYALARRLVGGRVSANCLHPGVVRTRITRDFPALLQPMVLASGVFMLSPARGARTSVYLAASPDVQHVSGKYFVKCREAPSSTLSQNVDAQERLWDISAELSGVDA